MRVPAGLLGVSQSAQRLNHIRLRVRLPRINYVVNGLCSAKVWVIRLTRLSRNPAGVVRIFEEFAVSEIPSQQAKLPEMVGDVLADVGYCSVRADDDLGVFIGALAAILFRRACILSPAKRAAWTANPAARAAHDPAAFIFALFFVIEDATFLQLLEGQVPEVQMKDLALARQQVVFNAQPQHRFQMPAQNGRRDEVANLRGLACALFNGVQRIEPNLFACRLLRLVSVIPLRDARIQVPAVVINLFAALL